MHITKEGIIVIIGVVLVLIGLLFDYLGVYFNVINPTNALLLLIVSFIGIILMFIGNYMGKKLKKAQAKS